MQTVFVLGPLILTKKRNKKMHFKSKLKCNFFFICGREVFLMK